MKETSVGIKWGLVFIWTNVRKFKKVYEYEIFFEDIENLI